MSAEVDPQLVQAACDPSGLLDELGPEGGAAFLAAHAAEVADLRAFLVDVREDVAAARPAGLAFSAQRVTRRVLARTTREESGWRGDLRLVGDFVVDRLRASAWLRVAVALLVVQVTVVPLVAWHMLEGRAGRGVLNVSFERPDTSAEFEAPVAELPLVDDPSREDAAARAARITDAAARLRVAARATRASAGDAAFAVEALAAAPTDERLAGLRVLALLEALGEAPIGAAMDPAGALEVAAAASEAAGDEQGRDAARLVRLDVAIDRRCVTGAAPELVPLIGQCFELLDEAVPGTHAAAVRTRLAALGLATPLGGAPSHAEVRPSPGPASGGLLAAPESTPAGPLARRFADALAGR